MAQIFVAGRVGSGYLVGPGLVLGCGHVLVEAGVDVGGTAEVAILGNDRWYPATVSWLDAELDSALLRFDPTSVNLDQVQVLRWGRIVGGAATQIGAAAVGFPWAQERIDGARGTEHIVGFISPTRDTTALRVDINVVSAAPKTRRGAVSAWAGISGAGLIVGPYLVGIVLADPARYEQDRLVAVPVERLLTAEGFAAELGESPQCSDVGGDWRLEYASGKFAALKLPYRPIPRSLTVAAAPTRLLDPVHNVVPFDDRNNLVRELTHWCTQTGTGVRIYTVTGSGGSGKTRLAAETCLALLAQGWEAGFADENRPEGTTRWQLHRQTLLVVDDADLRVTLVSDLVNALASADLPIRLLLLARDREPWWRQLTRLTETVTQGLDDGNLSLNTYPLDRSSREAHYARALHAFSEALGTADGSASAPAPAFESAAFSDPLVVHLTALLAASGEAVSPELGGGAPQASLGITRVAVLRAFLEREALRWEHHLPTLRIDGFDSEALMRCVATAGLGAPTEESAGAEFLKAVPEFADEGLRVRLSLARWLHDLQPGQSYWNPVRPDPLADQLLADTSILPSIAKNVLEKALRESDSSTLERLLAELTRASGSGGGAATTALDLVLDSFLAPFVERALSDPANALNQILLAALVEAPTPKAAAEVLDRLPSERVLALDELFCVIAEQAVSHYRSSATGSLEDVASLAAALTDLSNRRGNAGRDVEALEAIDEAVERRRDLASREPGNFKLLLAMALGNLSGRLGAMNRPRDALDASQEALSLIQSELEFPTPGDQVILLAAALNNFSIKAAEAGVLRAHSLLAGLQALRLYRWLTDKDQLFQPDLAMARQNSANRFHDLGWSRLALSASRQAVHAYGRLVSENPQTYTPELATALARVSSIARSRGDLDEAEVTGRQAVDILRGLADGRRPLFLPLLARALAELAVSQGQTNPVSALNHAEEAISYLSELLDDRKEENREALVKACAVAASLSAELGQKRRAVAHAAHAVHAARGRASHSLHDVLKAVRELDPAGFDAAWTALSADELPQDLKT